MTESKHPFWQAFTWFVYKFTSGRFILTLMAGAGLLMMEWAILDVLKMKAEKDNSISATEILAFASTIFVVIQSVFMSYFNMRRDSEGDNGNDNNKKEQKVHPDDEFRPKTPNING
jgi:hypothetical protein